MKNQNAALSDKATEVFESLPSEISGFSLKKIFAEDEDKFFYFSFENKKIHRAVTAYFHEETAEFKVRVKIGLTEFCLTEFFTEDFDDFSEKIFSNLEPVIKNLSAENDLNPIVKALNFSSVLKIL